tara:strand:+ start:13028 stop:13246 length:219 start_codon:yes stop_codon:yes gene_type:complete
MLLVRRKLSRLLELQRRYLRVERTVYRYLRIGAVWVQKLLGGFVRSLWWIVFEQVSHHEQNKQQQNYEHLRW